MAIVIVFLVGVGVALAKPGDLGGTDHEQAATTTTTLAPVTTTEAPTTTTMPVSGLGTGGAGSAGGRGLATTGGELWALPGGVLLVAALATRRLLTAG